MSAALSAISRSLDAHALTVLGHCVTLPADKLGRGTIILIGPSEPAFWRVFTAAPEYNDGMAHPLDRWSRRVLGNVANAQGATPLFPFGGPPYSPFFTWAERTGRFWSSPIGFLVHDTAGLFVSFRGALLVQDEIPARTGTKPCETCPTEPCRTACPVDAFSSGYDVAACKSHIAAPEGAACMSHGCQARSACPVGQGNRLPAQAAFHMKAFL